MDAATQSPSLSTEVQTRAHHKYGPSKMNYLDDCAGFTSRTGTSEAAEQGTFLHDLMEKAIKNVVGGKSKTTLEQVSGWMTKVHEIDDEEVEYLRICCRRADAFLSKKPSRVLTEIKVVVKHPDGSEFNSGYLDVLYIFGNVGCMQDFKFGWVPVRPPQTNLQGFNYVLGCFQMFPDLQRIGIEFVQPKITPHPVSRVFERAEIFELYSRLRDVVARADEVHADPVKGVVYMKAGNYCQYCLRAGSCAVLNNMRAIPASKFAMLPTPPSFKGAELVKPEDIALARYWVDVIETGVSEIKDRAFRAAEENGGSIECTLPNGEVVRYEIQQRNASRSLGSAVEVADALKDFCSAQEVLAAADLAITKLEPIVKQALVEYEANRGKKITKKAAWEIVQSTLEAQGLITRPDTQIRFLKMKKSMPALPPAK